MDKKLFRAILDKLFEMFCIFSTLIGIITLFILLARVLGEALPWLDWQLLPAPHLAS